MKSLTRMALEVYRLLLKCYPAGFRAEFSDEMQTVFVEAMTKTQHLGNGKLRHLFWRELKDLLGSIPREHLRERRKNMATNNAYIEKKPGWSFYPAWIFLSMLCIPTAFILDLVILKIITKFVGDFIYVNGLRHITEDYLAMYTFVPIVGLIIGLLQYGLLRRYLPQMGWWVLVTIGGWVVGGLLIIISGWLKIWTYESFDISLALILMGLSIGAGQWLLLRRRLPRAGWWVGANVLGWGLVGLITGDTLDQFGLLALGLLPACITALMLAIYMNWTFPTKARDA